MNRRSATLIASLAALVGVGGYLFLRSQTPLYEPAPVGAVAAPSGAEQSATSNSRRALPDAASAATQAATVRPADAVSDYDPEQDDGQIAFRADVDGRLLTNEKTRLDLERLHALYNAQEREKKLQEAAATLPPEAARQLFQLMEQYQNYQAAAYQAYPPGREMTSVEQGASQIDGMHGLRVQYFGERATAQMFGAEEKVQRELYELIENEKDPGLTLEEKAERAQQLYQRNR